MHSENLRIDPGIDSAAIYRPSPITCAQCTFLSSKPKMCFNEDCMIFE